MSSHEITADLIQDITDRCTAMEIPIMGIAPVNRWKEPLFSPWIPKEFFPDSIYPEAQSVLVIGLPVPLPVLETSPSIWYREQYFVVNDLLDQYSYRLSEFLCRRGFPSVYIPRDGYGSIDVLLESPVAFFSHRHAAYLAGLGTFGVNNMLLTREFGPRIRFGSVLTSAILPPTHPIMAGQLCTRCMECVLNCPSSALNPEDYPNGITDTYACAAISATLNKRYAAPCGICIKVCPVGEDRKFYRREDIGIYRDRNTSPGLHQAWDHVRAYGVRSGKEI